LAQVIQTLRLQEWRRVVTIHALAFVVVSGIWAYIVYYGGTWHGLLNPAGVNNSLRILTTALAVWVAVRAWRGWNWHVTALEIPLLFWIPAFVLSTLPNLEQINKIAVGLWFSGLYVVLWYFLQDLLANRVLTRTQLIDCLLIAGIAVLFVGYRDSHRPTAMATLDNENILGNYLVIIIPLAVSRAIALRGIWRVLAAIYATLAALLLVASMSRGAALGLIVSAVVLGLLLRPPGKVILIGIVFTTLIVGPLLFVRFLRPYGDNRGLLFQHAIDEFREQPITGNGLFTYRLRIVSEGRRPAHTHAHNLVLNIAAELGIVGLIAFVATSISCFFAIRRNWQSGEDRIVLAGIIGSIIGTAGHLMVDVPIFTPAVALTFLVVAVAGTAPVLPVPVKRPWVVALVIVLIFVLVIGGFYSNYNFPKTMNTVLSG
jgi:O-antigen ligase